MIVKESGKQTWFDHRWRHGAEKWVQTDKHGFVVSCLEHIDAGMNSLYPGISDIHIIGFLIIDLLYMVDEPDHPNIRQTIEQGFGISSLWLDVMFTWDCTTRRTVSEIDRWFMFGCMVLNPSF